MSETNDNTAGTGRGDPILPGPIGEDGIVQPERDEGEKAESRPKSGSGGAGADEEAHDLAHGNDLKTP